MATIDTSGIDITKPEAGEATTQSVRDNTSAIKTALDSLSLTTNGNGAALVGVEDAAANFAGEDVEAVLAEIVSNLASTANGKGASTVGIEDVAANFTATDVEAALAEIISDLASTANGLGASTVGVEDSGANFTGTTVEAVLAEIQDGIDDTTGFPAGTVVQVVNTTDGAVATGTTTIPADDTIPQNTEGDEYMTLAITPKYSDSKLKIEVQWYGANSSASATSISAALFQDSTASALASAWTSKEGTANTVAGISLLHYMTSGTTSSTTFKVRAGAAQAGTTTFNGASGGRLYGGNIVSGITITEVKQ